jgi:hypothetical protein
MTDHEAAGPKTEIQNERCDRVAAGLEAMFQHTSNLLEDAFAMTARYKGYTADELREIAIFLKIGAQLAGQVARLEAVKNHHSKAK